MYYPSSENKGAYQLRGVTAKLIGTFVFIQAFCWFSYAVALFSSVLAQKSQPNFFFCNDFI